MSRNARRVLSIHVELSNTQCPTLTLTNWEFISDVVCDQQIMFSCVYIYSMVLLVVARVCCLVARAFLDSCFSVLGDFLLDINHQNVYQCFRLPPVRPFYTFSAKNFMRFGLSTVAHSQFYSACF